MLNNLPESFVAGLIALISLVGSAVATQANYIEAANFLGLEAFVFLIVGMFLRLSVLLRK